MIFLVTSDIAEVGVTLPELQRRGVPILVVGAEAGAAMGMRLDYGGVVLATEDAAITSFFAEGETAPCLPIVGTAPRTTMPLDGQIRDFYRACGGRMRFCTHGLQADAENGPLFYFGYPLPVSAVEARVLICLLRQAPNGIDGDALMALCFGGSPATERTLVRTVIGINRAAGAITGLRLVVKQNKGGYRLADGLVHRRKDLLT